MVSRYIRIDIPRHTGKHLVTICKYPETWFLQAGYHRHYRVHVIAHAIVTHFTTAEIHYKQDIEYGEQ